MAKLQVQKSDQWLSGMWRGRGGQEGTRAHSGVAETQAWIGVGHMVAYISQKSLDCTLE